LSTAAAAAAELSRNWVHGRGPARTGFAAC